MSISFGGQYTPPGVYVDTGPNPAVAPVGVNPSIVCIIGTGIGYNTYTESDSFASSNSVVLTQQGINASSVVVTGYVTDPNASGNSIPTTFVQGASGTGLGDYYVTQVNVASGGPTDTITTIVKTSGSTISSTYPNVSVSYQYTNASYYGLNSFTDFTSLTDVYGLPLNPTTGLVASPISLAAQFAIQNGANQIYVLALSGTGTIQQQFASAYATLSGINQSVNLVVPLWEGVTDPGVIAGMLSTLNAALTADYNDGVLRMAIVGLSHQYSESLATTQGLATGIASERIVLAWPNQLSIYNGVTNGTDTISGYHLAAAYAGLLSAQVPNMPLTASQPLGFSGIPSAMLLSMTTTNKNALSSSGISVTEPARTGGLRVRHGLTTNYAGGELTYEISLVRQSDALYELVQTALNSAQLIGQPIIATTALSVKGVVNSALETAIAANLIIGYSGLQVREQSPPSGDPTVIEVQFAFQPTYPLNYVLVNFTVDTTTGITTVNTAGSSTTGTTTNS
jgi:hypothetical protein